jgi:3-hydroxymyristoyl/3-hydroxydecanoyl-(acyl carrier protein) dehydratase
LNRDAIRALLPYGEDFLFLDWAEHLQERQITAQFTWLRERPELHAHFAGGPPVVPGVLLAEQVMQSALLLAILEGRHLPRRPAQLGQFRCEIFGVAAGGCRIQTETTIDVVLADKCAFRGTCMLDGKPIAMVRGIATIQTVNTATSP